MVEKLQPTAIVEKFPDIQIVQIPNYSKQWHEREKNKVTDKNAMEAATFYIEWGMYVIFLHEKPEEGGRPADKQIPGKIVIISLHEWFNGKTTVLE